MNQVSYQALFLLICIGAIAYLMRNNFRGTEQKLRGVFVPRALITTVLCILLGLFLWIVINIVLSKI